MAHFEDRDTDFTREADQDEEEEDEGPVVEYYVDAALEAYWWSWGEHYCKLQSCLTLAVHGHSTLIPCPFSVVARYQFFNCE